MVEEVARLEVGADDDVGAACLALGPVELGGAPRDDRAELHLADDADGGVPRGFLHARGEQVGNQAQRLAHHLGRRSFVGALVRVRDEGAVNLGQHLLRDQVARHRAGADRDLRQHLGRHDGVHADVAEHHDVVRVVPFREIVRKHEDADLADHRSIGQHREHRPEVALRTVGSAADHHVGVAEVHGVDAEQGWLRHRLLRFRQVERVMEVGRVGPVGGGELPDQIRAAGDVDEGALPEAELDPRAVQMGEVAERGVPDGLLAGQQHGLDVACEVADRLEDAGVQRLGHDDNRPVSLRSEDLRVERLLDSEHVCGPPGSRGGPSIAGPAGFGNSESGARGRCQAGRRGRPRDVEWGRARCCARGAERGRPGAICSITAPSAD